MKRVEGGLTRQAALAQEADQRGAGSGGSADNVGGVHGLGGVRGSEDEGGRAFNKRVVGAKGAGAGVVVAGGAPGKGDVT